MTPQEALLQPNSSQITLDDFQAFKKDDFIAWLKREYQLLFNADERASYRAFELYRAGAPRIGGMGGDMCNSQAVSRLRKLLSPEAQAEFLEAVLALRGEWLNDEWANTRTGMTGPNH